eukprot:TRINITY_DN50169_c0_g1_i1.p1 TRINITY_DN50169_c0_g1~~TRINITY_DN50169_c0_g1_i1.p1  ORF type:complete len:1103 (+),score=289.01 TRINITY_DN50169_c0_g1_i1:75-3311(+)
MASPLRARPSAQRRDEEVLSLAETCDGLSRALGVFTTRPTEPPPACQEAASMAEVVDLFDLALRVVRGASPCRLAELLLPGDSGGGPPLLAVLLRYVTAPLCHAPGARGAEAQRQIAALRVSALRALCQLLALTAADGAPAGGGGEAPEGPLAELSQRAAATVAAEGGYAALLGIATAHAAHVPDEARLAAAECLFVLTAKSRAAREHIAGSPSSVERLLAGIRADRSPLLRNFLAACIRELAQQGAERVAHSGFTAAVPQLLGDPSSDVRALTLETLAALLADVPRSALPPPDWSEVIPAVASSLTDAAGSDVVHAAARLLDACFTEEHAFRVADPAAHSEVTERWVRAAGCPLLLRAVLLLPVGDRAAAMAARALRHAVELAPPQLAAGESLMSDPRPVRALLQLLRDLDPDPDDIHATITIVELAMALALAAAQSPRVRAALHGQLVDLPGPVLRRVVGQLQRASAEYYAGVAVADVCGERLDTVRSCVEWDARGRPTRDSVARLFARQEQHAAGRAVEAEADPPVAAAEGQQQRLTFFVLAFAVELAASPPSGDDAAPSPTRQSIPSPKVDAWLRAQADEQGAAGAPAQCPPADWVGAPGASGPQRRPRGALSARAPAAPPVAVGSAPRTSLLGSAPPSRAVTPRGGAPPRRSTALHPLPANTAAHAAAYHADDAALALACSYSRHFVANLPPPRKPPPRHAGVSPAPNPWQPPRPQAVTSRAWSVADLKKGDLFCFHIPHEELCLGAAEHALFLAKRHLERIGEAWQTTPQRAKGRRWFLYDMQQNIMPRIQSDVLEIARACTRHGDEQARVALLTLRARERELGESGIGPSNLPECVEQLRYYFSQPRRRPPPTAAISALASAHWQADRSQAVCSTALFRDPQEFSEHSSSSSGASPPPPAACGRLKWDPRRTGPGVVLGPDLCTAGCRAGGSGASVAARHAVLGGKATWEVAVVEEGHGAAAGCLCVIGVAAGNPPLEGDPTNGAEAWGLYGAGCALHHNGQERCALQRPLRRGDRVRVELDAGLGTASFAVGGDHVGNYGGLPCGGPLRPFVTFFATGAAVRIVASWGFG